ncbi:hypothetical protein SinmeB_5130 (plasmid) [Sinorhizobium meliloti BL225C]|nr:hypothetical protein SinmeB_5130 [Sinorhizobium meliloti BL225C]SDY46260.1 hypothetical protein SAMN04244576_03590 [Sinorhizobium meliloti]
MFYGFGEPRGAGPVIYDEIGHPCHEVMGILHREVQRWQVRSV